MNDITIKLIRHGQSESNIGLVNPAEIGEFRVELTQEGCEQAFRAGQKIGEDFIRNSLIYCSPFERTRQTLRGILAGANILHDQIRVFEDPRLREVDSGYWDRDSQNDLRRVHNWFYYRFAGGESPADGYDRISTFLESLMRQSTRKNIHNALIVSHGLTIRCFLMRFLHLTVEQFCEMDCPDNAVIITVGLKNKLEEKPVYVSGKWGVIGISKRND